MQRVNLSILHARTRLLVERLVVLWCLFWLAMVLFVVLVTVLLAFGLILLVTQPYKLVTGKHRIEGFGATLAI